MSAKISYQGIVSNTQPVRIIDAAPGIFTLDATGQGAILNQDSTVNSVNNGALPGSVVSIYATGEGLTDPLLADGAIVSTVLPQPRLTVKVQIAGQDCKVTYAGSAPAEPVGVLQVNAVVPAGLHSGAATVVITVGTASSQNGVIIGIR